MKKYTILLFALYSFCSLRLVHAQTSVKSGAISGKVLDEKKQAFPYATIGLLNAKDSTAVQGTLTKENGQYEFKDIALGNYLVSIYVVGYKKVFKGPFALNSAKSAYLVEAVQLIPDAKQLQGVEIVKQKPLVERQLDKTVLNVENSTLAVGNTALDILEKSPGVSVDKDGNISLRGKQGVTVMLDGKPTYLSSEQLANLLRSMEGSAIKSIELITNPSAKYDAAGNSGIINIKLKKNSNYGTNGTIFAGSGYGTYYKANGGFTLNHRKEKFNVFGNVDYGRNKRFNDLDIYRVNNTLQDQTIFDQTSNNIRNRNNSNYKAGVDYFLNDKNTIGFVFTGYNSNGDSNADVLTLIGSTPAVGDSSVVAKNLSNSKYTGMTFNVNYKSVIDTLGQELTIDADFAQYDGIEENAFDNLYLNSGGQQSRAPYLFQNGTPSIVKIWSGKVDYTYPLNKDMKLETGVKTSFVSTDNNYKFLNFNHNNNLWENDPTRSNQFIYDENINAAYININRKFKSTSVQVGLRAEQTNSKGNSVTESRIVKRDYLNFFPSIFLNQDISKNHSMGLSYSRRIDRPDYGSLNPFVYYVDLYSYQFGNPFLKPQYTNSFELSYSFKKTLNATLGYSHTSDVITEVLLSDTAKKTIFISNENLATQDSYNLNISSPLPITKWWSTNNNLTVFYNRFESPNLANAPYKSGRLAFNFNTNQTITINPTTNFELSGFFVSKQVYGTLLIDPMYAIDMGLSKNFMDKKLNIKLAANDVFNIRKNKITSALPSQNYLVRIKWESQVFRATVTYRFGSTNIKGARERSSSADAEARRVKSGAQ
ncbi:outer membrane receptor protein involved in Fe transport [Pedobacter sp. CAN_A7]|uniref:TonB-dependent receptor domain-containing protein n=1 Tax=Pedobacter sp. CAN_A7 TaxID=2787722 RepID=UPI0018CBD557